MVIVEKEEAVMEIAMEVAMEAITMETSINKQKALAGDK